MNRDHSSALASSAAAFYFTAPCGFSEPLMSTGFDRVYSMPTIPPARDDLAPMNASRRSFRQAQRSTSDSLPPVPPPTPQLSARMAPEDCGDDDARNRRVPAPSPSATQLKRHTVGDEGIGGLAFVPVTLVLCAFVWLVASGALANQAGAVGQEPDGAREEAAEPAVVLHLENFGSAPPIKAGVGETVAEIRTRTTRTVGRRRTTTASGRATEYTMDDLGEDDLSRESSKAHKTEGPRKSEDADATDVLYFTPDAEPTQGFQGIPSAEAPVGSEAIRTAHPDGSTTRAKHDHSRKGSRRSKRRRFYPRRHIHRTAP
ncbi:uncharacterized protein [Dermacentor andersoni]|uniref:uncharacterized protein n=1 Tax=Dermacentor andersoni TaxID=34620 RepID=UPI0024163112|nr:uncharacterized protein LOC129387792 [Dermacentor andersoni]